MAESLTEETNYLNNVSTKNNYNADFIRRNTYKPAEHNEANANPTPSHYSDNTSHRGHFWGHRTDTTTLQYPCCSQIHYDFAIASNQRWAQRQT